MTEALLNDDGGEAIRVGKSVLPNIDNSVAWVSGNNESPEIDIRGYRGIGLHAPDMDDLVGATEIQIHVATKKGGLYGLLPGVDPITLLQSAIVPFSTSFIAEWSSMKFVIVGTLTGSGNMPYCLS